MLFSQRTDLQPMLSALCLGMGGRSHGRPLLRPALVTVLMACLVLDATAFAWSPHATVCLGSQRALPLCRSGLHSSRHVCADGRATRRARSPERCGDGHACVQSCGDAFASPVGARARRPPRCRRASPLLPACACPRTASTGALRVVVSQPKPSCEIV
jgi:hypothetical protein